MPSGMIVQRSSSASDPWIASPTSSSCLRWNLTANTTTSIAMSAVKNAVTATRKKYRASICPACSEAACGKKGKFVNIRLSARLSRRSLSGGRLAAETDEQERQEAAHRQNEADPDRVEHRAAVFPRRRVV